MKLLNYNNPFLTVGSMSLYSLYLLKTERYTPSDLAKMFLISSVLFTFAEYIIHRFFFHHFPYIKNLHWYHHRKPTCERALHVPTVPTIAFLVAFTESGKLPFISNVINRFSETNYLIRSAYIYIPLWVSFFELSHRSSHKYCLFQGLIPKNCITFHSDHHRYPSTNYGFTTSFWDFIFFTLGPNERFRLRLPIPLLDFLL